MSANGYDIDALLAEAAARKQQRGQGESHPPIKGVSDVPSSERVPLSSLEEATCVMPAVKPENTAATSEDMTRVVELPERHRKPSAPAKPTTDVDGQMDWSNIGIEQPPEETVDEDELCRQLKESRDKRVSEFRLSGMEEESAPEEILEPERPALDDYDSYENSETVRNDLEYQRSTALVTVFMSVLLEIILLALTLVTRLVGAPPFEPVMYVVAHIALLGLMMVMNHRLVGGGIANIFRGKADTATAASVPCVPVLIHTAWQLLHLTAPQTGDGMYTAAAGLCLVIGAIGRYFRVARVADNFRFVSFEGSKSEVALVEGSDIALKIGRTAVEAGVPRIAHPRPASFLNGFLAHSYADDALDAQSRRLVPLSLGMAAITAAVYGAVYGDWWLAYTAFTVTVCLLFACSPLFTAATALHRGAKRALRAGALISGYEAVDTFGDMDAVTVEAEELFSADTLVLHGIRTFKGARIDEAIMDAAAVSIAEGGPLSFIFRQIITDRVDILQPVDSLVYEQDMGVSGWVGGRRVLVGNRRLLENHGVDVPSRAYEERYAVEGRKLVYLSTAGELSAMFVISYLAEETLAEQLETFSRCHVDMLIHSCDPNVTEELVCNTWGLDDFYITVMDAQAARAFVSLHDEEQPREAVLATDGRLSGLIAALQGCHRLRRVFKSACVMGYVGAAVSLLANMVLLFATGVVFTPLLTAFLVVICTALGWLISRLCG